MKKTIVTGLWVFLLTSLLTLPAFAQELIVGGQAVGIQISTDGVLVAGLCEVDGSGGISPAQSAGLQAGDRIVAADGVPVPDAATLMEAIEKGEGGVTLSVLRGERSFLVTVEPALSGEGRPMLGLLLRDGLSGIGTLTFFDPDSGVFGALGHSINDAATGLAVPVRGGSITDAQIVSVTPGAAGAPGELGGVADLGRILGEITRNSEAGIFGLSSEGFGGKRLETGELAAGPASIVSTVNGHETREYTVEINRVYREAGGTHAMLSVTDAELLARTGGIVQGMSGSPILQNGRLVGAVTHVFVSDPRRGYAVSIQDMLRAAAVPELAA